YRKLSVRLREITLCDQVLEIVEPFIFRYVRAHTISLQILVLVPYRLRLGSAKKVDQICHPETLPGPVNSTQCFLRDDRAIERLRDGHAVVAIPAVAFEFLGEVVQKISPPACAQVAELAHLVEFLEHYFALCRVALD